MLTTDTSFINTTTKKIGQRFWPIPALEASLPLWSRRLQGKDMCWSLLIHIDLLLRQSVFDVPPNYLNVLAAAHFLVLEMCRFAALAECLVSPAQLGMLSFWAPVETSPAQWPGAAGIQGLFLESLRHTRRVQPVSMFCWIPALRCTK